MTAARRLHPSTAPALCLLSFPLSQKLCEIVHCLGVAGKAAPGDCVRRHRADIADLPKCLALADLGDVHLDGGDAHALYGVCDGDAGVGIGGGVEDDAVNAVKIRLLYRVNKVALVVGLVKLDPDPQLFRVLAAVRCPPSGRPFPAYSP